MADGIDKTRTHALGVMPVAGSIFRPPPAGRFLSFFVLGKSLEIGPGARKLRNLYPELYQTEDTSCTLLISKPPWLCLELMHVQFPPPPLITAFDSDRITWSRSLYLRKHHQAVFKFLNWSWRKNLPLSKIFLMQLLDLIVNIQNIPRQKSVVKLR